MVLNIRIQSLYRVGKKKKSKVTWIQGLSCTSCCCCCCCWYGKGFFWQAGTEAGRQDGSGGQEIFSIFKDWPTSISKLNPPLLQQQQQQKQLRQWQVSISLWHTLTWSELENWLSRSLSSLSLSITSYFHAKGSEVERRSSRVNERVIERGRESDIK